MSLSRGSERDFHNPKGPQWLQPPVPGGIRNALTSFLAEYSNQLFVSLSACILRGPSLGELDMPDSFMSQGPVTSIFAE